MVMHIRTRWTLNVVDEIFECTIH
uniref:Uncharacterized protein n=1 Tax=Arundo donax TaxID=35708 RepID=A0A0A9HTX5_ARUDO